MNELADLLLVYRQDANVPYLSLLNLFMVLGLSFIVRAYYMHYARPLSNLSQIGNIIPMLSAITFLVILVVKSSLALSLGLVGALSIVRFRTPIKEPQELTFIFLAIAIGLGIAANQTLITALVTIIILIVDFFRHKYSSAEEHSQSLHIEAPSLENKETNFDEYLRILEKHFSYVHISRVDFNSQNLSFVVKVDLKDTGKIQAITNDLKTINPEISCSIFDAKPIW